MNNYFLITSDLNTALLLAKNVFQKVSDSNGIHIFLNSNKIQFSNEIDKSKVRYSDVLTF